MVSSEWCLFLYNFLLTSSCPSIIIRYWKSWKFLESWKSWFWQGKEYAKTLGRSNAIRLAAVLSCNRTRTGAKRLFFLQGFRKTDAFLLLCGGSVGVVLCYVWETLTSSFGIKNPENPGILKILIQTKRVAPFPLAPALKGGGKKNSSTFHQNLRFAPFR